MLTDAKKTKDEVVQWMFYRITRNMRGLFLTVVFQFIKKHFCPAGVIGIHRKRLKNFDNLVVFRHTLCPSQ